MKYIVVHSHPEKLVVPQQQRDMLFSTGNLLELFESSLYSLQSEVVDGTATRPLGLVLWGVEDRYGVVPPDVEVFRAKSWGDAYNFCRGYRPETIEKKTEEGFPYTHTDWKSAQAEPPRQFVLIQDGSCHWYVCPADKEDEADRYFEAVSGFWDDLDAKGNEPERPEWLDEVGGAPSLVKFTGYSID